MSWQDLLELTKSGGDAALLVCVYFMWKLNDRLIKMEILIGMMADKLGLKGSGWLKHE